MVARETAAKDGQEGLWFPADIAGYMTLAKSAAQVARAGLTQSGHPLPRIIQQATGQEDLLQWLNG
jgi:hypothetical protein